MARSSFRQLLSQPWRVCRSGAEGRKGTTRPVALEQLEERTVLSPLRLVTAPDLQVPASDSTGGVSGVMTSAGGRFLVYASTAANLVPGQVNTAVADNVFLYDRTTGTTTLVSHAVGSSATGGNGDSDNARISGDGHYVVYTSSGTNLVAGQTGLTGETNVFLYDTTTGTNRLVSHRFDSATAAGNGDSYTADTTGFGFSANVGHYLLFTSTATDLIAGQAGPQFGNLFLYDTAAGTTTLVSHNASSLLTGGNDFAEAADLTPDGGKVVFQSFATDMVPGQTGPRNNIFLYDSATGNIQLISGVSDGCSGNSATVAAGFSFQPSISSDGGIISYVSYAPNLVAGQRPGGKAGVLSLFVYDTFFETTTLVSGSGGSSTVTANGDVGATALSGDGSTLAFTTAATDLIPGQGNGSWNVFLYHVFTGSLTLASHFNGFPGVGAGGTVTSASGTFNDLSISDDGRLVAYESTSGSLAAGQSGPSAIDNVFVYDDSTGANTLVSKVNGSTAAGGNQHSFFSRLSPDGSTVAFLSLATNLVPGANVADGGENLFRFDLAGDSGPVLLSRSAFPASATSLVYGSSGDGRFVLFSTNATNAVPGQVDHNFDQDVFLLDRDTGTTTLVSHVPGLATTTGNLGTPATGGISNDGNVVAFVSAATNLASGPRPFLSNNQVFLFNRLTGAITLVSHAFGSPQNVGGGSADSPVLSADGRYVAYRSFAPDVVAGGVREPGDGILVSNIYLYDSLTDTTTLVSHGPGDPLQGSDYPSVTPVISDDGRFVAYRSLATTLTAGAAPATENIYLFDRTTGVNTLVSHTAASATTPAGGATDPVLSADGSTVAFTSFAPNLVPGQQPSPFTSVFRYDVASGVVTLVSGAGGSATRPAGGYSDSPAVSADGTTIAFRSDAPDVVPGQVNTPGATSNVFRFDGRSGAVSLVSHAAGLPTTTAAGASSAPSIDGAGDLIAYLSTASNLVPNTTLSVRPGHVPGRS
jgi:Tol biopolymer transport system component